MDTCVAGFSFASEIEANRFRDAVMFCKQNDAFDFVEAEIAKAEKSYILNGSVHTAGNAEEARIMQQAAQTSANGEIIDGIQLRWKKNIPPEMLALLGASMESSSSVASPSSSAATASASSSKATNPTAPEDTSGGSMWKKNVATVKGTPEEEMVAKKKRRTSMNPFARR
jgi:hypothetical protein